MLIRRVRLCRLAACLPILSAAAPADADPQPLSLDTAEIESAVTRLLDARDVPGCVVGVVVGMDLVYAKPFGVSNVESRSPMRIDTLFQIGSVTKTMTALLTCVLRDKGVLRLDDPAHKFLPSGVHLRQHALGHPITVFHLLTHTSGLPTDPLNRRNVSNTPSVMAPYSVPDLLEAVSGTRPATPAGRQWTYSNFGYGLLGHLLERAAGKQYEELLREYIFNPLDMKDSRITLGPDQRTRLASHCWPQDAPRVAREPWIFGDVAAFGGVVSTVPDLARFITLHFAFADPPSPFTAASLLDTRTPRHIINPRTWNYGMALGWWVQRHEEFGNLVAHGGEVDGQSAFVVFSPDHAVGVIVLSIVGADTAETIARQVLPHVIRPALTQWAQLDTLHEAHDWEGLRQTAKALTERNPVSGRAHYELGYAALMLGNLSEGTAASLRAAELGFQTPQSHYNAACGYARSGARDKAFEQLRAACRTGFRNHQAAAQDPDLAELRNDPRWDEFLGRVKG